MEKNRWSLIFIGLCLALVFSVSSVEAQLCKKGNFCDRDRDGFFKDHHRCVPLCTEDKIDCDDTDRDVNPGEENCDALVTLVVCHFKNTLKHCVRADGVAIGGGEETVENFNFSSSKDVARLERHLAHGDCEGEGSFERNPTVNGTPCLNHCIAIGTEVEGTPRCSN